MLPAARWAFGPHAADDQPDQTSVHGLPGGPCTPVLPMTSRIRSLCIHCLPWAWAGQMSARIRGPIWPLGPCAAVAMLIWRLAPMLCSAWEPPKLLCMPHATTAPASSHVKAVSPGASVLINHLMHAD